MGYLLATEGVDFFIPALHAEPALNVMSALNLVGTEKLGSTYVEALSRALTNLGYHVTATEGGVRIDSFHDVAHPSIEFAVLALASFVAEGSYIEWRGEDGIRSRELIRDGLVWHQTIESGGPWKDDGFNKPPQFITSIPITYRTSNKTVSGVLDCGGLITRSQFLALRAALHNRRSFKPGQVGLPPLKAGCGDRWHEADIDAIETAFCVNNVRPAGANRIAAGDLDEFIKNLSVSTPVEDQS